ncbi:hypothetical protein PV327_005137 [Microctonus hyperodae]|uniref:F-box domain-containing protein n=1 Tax=Microctonus hyperodae TaxID=165561 RepID=A0AA39KZD7_MICHY|nr:hypothetical protein PV327_005137 [Microctonus hyperodae]
MATIEILNEDVLREIFSYLSFHERYQMGFVCKKWRNVHESMISIHRLHCVKRDFVNHKRLIQIFNDTLDVLIDDRADVVALLKKYASAFKEIIIKDIAQENIPRSIYKLLSESTQLNYVDFHCERSESLERFLKFLPTKNLEYLSINFGTMCKCIEPRLNFHLKKVLGKTTKLKHLHFDSMYISEFPLIGGIGTLKKLTLRIIDTTALNSNIEKLQNLETLDIVCQEIYNAANITKLMRICRKLHTIQFWSHDMLPETTLNEMISLPNLRNLNLITIKNSYKSWYKFSNLERIGIWQKEALSPTRDQIQSFLERSKNLKTYEFMFVKPNGHFNNLFQKVATDIGHKCERYCSIERSAWKDMVRNIEILYMI